MLSALISMACSEGGNARENSSIDRHRSMVATRESCLRLCTPKSMRQINVQLNVRRKRRNALIYHLIVLNFLIFLGNFHKNVFISNKLHNSLKELDAVSGRDKDMHCIWMQFWNKSLTSFLKLAYNPPS